MFVQVYDTQLVDLDVIWFFEDDDINDCFPSAVGVFISKGEIDEFDLTLNQSNMFSLKKISLSTIHTGGSGAVRVKLCCALHGNQMVMWLFVWV